MFFCSPALLIGHNVYCTTCFDLNVWSSGAACKMLQSFSVICRPVLKLGSWSLICTYVLLHTCVQIQKVIKIMFKDIVDRYMNCRCCAAVMFVGDVVLLRSVWKANPGKSSLFFFCISSGIKIIGGFVVSLFRYYCTLYVYQLSCNYLNRIFVEQGSFFAITDSSKPNYFFTQHILDTGHTLCSSDDMSLFDIAHVVKNEHRTEISYTKSVREVHKLVRHMRLLQTPF